MSLPKLLRFKHLQEREIVTSRAQLKEMQENYGFPLGRWITPNARVWTEDEVNAWLESRPIAVENKSVKITENHISKHPEISRQRKPVAAE